MSAGDPGKTAQSFLDAVESTASLLERTSPLYTISGEQDPSREYLTPGQALACLTIAQKYIERIAGPGWEAKLYRDHEGPYWNISLEGADEWAITITHDESITWPDGVFAEPGAGWCLNLHPA